MANPKRALLLAIALAFAGTAGAQRVTTTTATPTNGSTVTTGTTTSSVTTSTGATTNTTSSIPMPPTTAPAPSGPATSSSSSSSSGSGGNTAGSAGSTGATPGSTAAGTAVDTSTLAPSNLNSGTANSLPTGTDNSATSTATTPAPFDSGTGTLLGAPVVGATADDYVIGPNGERIPVNRSGTAAAPAAAETQQSLAASRALDARLDKSARETKERVARKGQVLNSIAPRTDVDRTDQMPDDSTPLLSPSRR